MTEVLDSTQKMQETILLALDPDQLRAAHSQMRQWASEMATLMGTQATGLRESVLQAKQHKWRHSTLAAALRMAEKRTVFYSKIVEALDAGYLLVPNFAMTTWVVRTDRNRPARGYHEEKRWAASRWFPQQPELLPPGEGRYVAENALSETGSYASKDDHGDPIRVFTAEATEFDDSPTFPFQFASPYVMDKVAQATTAKIFDEIGIAQDGAGRGVSRGDPILLGRLRNPRHNRPDATFFIAWALDLRRM